MSLKELLEPLVEHAPPPPSLDEIERRVSARRSRRRRRGAAWAVVATCAVALIVAFVDRSHGGRQSVETAGQPTPPTMAYAMPLFDGTTVPDPHGLHVTLDEATATVNVNTTSAGSQEVAVVVTSTSKRGVGSMSAAPALFKSISSFESRGDCGSPVIVAGLTVADATSVVVDGGSGAVTARTASRPDFPATVFIAKLWAPAHRPLITVTAPRGTIDNQQDLNTVTEAPFVECARPVVPPLAPPCSSDALAIRLGGMQGATGHRVAGYRIANTSSTPCSLVRAASVEFLLADGSAAPPTIARANSDEPINLTPNGDPSAAQPGQQLALVDVLWNDIDQANGGVPCPSPLVEPASIRIGIGDASVTTDQVGDALGHIAICKNDVQATGPDPLTS